jgi:hypothetical protein
LEIDIDMETEIDVNILNNEYIRACNYQSDINYHLPVLYELASSVKHVTELGVRDGQSTRAFLATDCILRSYDIYLDGGVEYLFGIARELGLDKKYMLGDSTQIDIEPTDLLFVDTEHSYAQVSKELARHHDKVSRYIVFHDTCTFAGPIGGCPVGIIAAVLEFLAANPKWRVMYHTHMNNGLTVLEKV